MTRGATTADRSKTVDTIAARKRVDGLKSRLRMAEECVRVEKARLGEAEAEVGVVLEASAVVQAVAQAVQQAVHVRIAAVVTRCLNAVFEDPYEFRIRFDRKRGKTEARMTFVRGGMELDDPMNEVGGGVVDVASLALRLACVVMARPVRRRLVVLDEPFAHIRGEGNRTRTREMLERLAEELGVQFVLCTDIEAYRMGNVVEVTDD
jgi:hypothetical protein